MSERGLPQRVIRTTAGDISPEELGPASMHEHLGIDVRVWATNRHPSDTRFRDEPVTQDIIPEVRWRALTFLDNLLVNDWDLLIEELMTFKRAGGGGLVEMTCRGLGRDPEAVAKIAQETGVHVVLACGYFTHITHEPAICSASVEDLEALLDAEIVNGVEGTSLLPGTLGEIGMSAPPEPCERRVLRAAARVALKHGMSVNVHVDWSGRFGLQHVRDCVAEGLPPDRVVIGHMDERIDESYQLQVLQTGANIALDTFGNDFYFSGVTRHPTDEQRMAHLAILIDQGYIEQILLAQDAAFKTNLHKFGGFGFDHLLTRIAPALEHEYGIDQAQIDQLLIDNPRRVLACTPP